MKAKEKLVNYLAENFGLFYEKLTTQYKSLLVDGDIDYNTTVFVLSVNDFKNLTGLAPMAVEYYQRSGHCGHEYDCCGCLSSQRIRIIKHANNYVSIFLTKRFNY